MFCNLLKKWRKNANFDDQEFLLIMWEFKVTYDEEMKTMKKNKVWAAVHVQKSCKFIEINAKIFHKYRYGPVWRIFKGGVVNKILDKNLIHPHPL